MAEFESSVITLHRRVSLAGITSGTISSLAPIAHVAFGDGGTDSSGHPIIPSETQTALTRELARYQIDEVRHPLTPPTMARYAVTIPAGDLSGARINEAALVDANGNLCAIKTFSDKGKDPGLAMQFELDDEF